MRSLTVKILSCIFLISTIASAEITPQLSEALKKSVKETEPKLGTLETWQKKIFDEEVVPLAPRFIRDYRQTSRGVSAEVDLAAIKKYLSFYGPLSYDNPKGPSMRVSVRSEENCPQCQEAQSATLETVKRRSVRRGFRVLDRGKGDADMVIWLKRIPLRDAESGHEDERGFRVELTFTSKDFTQEKKSDVLVNDPIDTAVSTVLSDWVADMSQRNFTAAAAGGAAGPSEVLFEAQPIRDLSHFRQLHALLQTEVQNVFGEQAQVVLRQQRTGSAVFALSVSTSVNDPRGQADRVIRGKNWLGANVRLLEGGVAQ